MSRTKRTPTEKIDAGLVPVEVSWHLRGCFTIQKRTLWCVNVNEARDFLEWARISHMQLGSFRAENFVITPEMRIITAENLGVMSTR